MPWERTDVGEERVKFVVRAVSGKEAMAVLCREFGVSRTTGYRWRHMYVREIDRKQCCTRALVRPRAVGRALRSPSGLPACPPNEPNQTEKV